MSINTGNIVSLLSQLTNVLTKLVNGTQVVGFEKLSVTTVASLTVPENATSCRIDISNAGVATGDVARYRMDGTAPTTSTGNILGHLDTLDINNDSNMRKAKFIATSGTTILNVSYFA